MGWRRRRCTAHLSSWLDKTVELPVDEDLFLEELTKRRANSPIKVGTGLMFDTKDSFGSASHS